MKKKMWMVRAGRGSYYVEDFEHKKIVGLGWCDVNLDLTTIKDKTKIIELLKNAFPDNKKGWYPTIAGQIYRFNHEIQLEDYVITYNGDKRVYLIGRVKSVTK